METLKRWGETLIQEILSNGIGFVAGLYSYQIVSQFFIKRSIWNLWGAFSSRTAVDETTYEVLAVVTAGVLGFVALSLTNYAMGFLVRRLFGSKDESQTKQVQKRKRDRKKK